jgi:hypothetical protein
VKIVCFKLDIYVSCPHLPYQHPDFFDFLKEVKSVYKPKRVVCTGDEADYHGISFHESDPDLPSAGDEHANTRESFKQLFKIFPKLDLLHSNHGSLPARKAKNAGLPKHMIRTNGEIIGSPKGWVWHDHLVVKSGHQEIYVVHQIKANSLQAALGVGMCVVQGHYHSKFDIQYISSPTQLIWGATIGCGIDRKSRAFAYNKLDAKRPILGALVSVSGTPVLIPMLLNDKGRWIGEL